MSSLSAMSSRAVITAQIDKVAEYHASLADIAAELTGVRDELVRLRTEAARLTTLLAERDDTVARLEHEHADTLDEARAASASLRKSDARLGVSREQVATLLQEQRELLTRLGEAERRVAQEAGAARALRDDLAERERTIVELRERGRRAEDGHRARQEAAAASLRDAQAQLDARQEQLAVLERERDWLRSRLDGS